MFQSTSHVWNCWGCLKVVFVSTGVHEVVCQDLTVEAAEGEDVLLRFYVRPQVNLTSYTVDIHITNSNLSVYSYRQGKHDFDEQEEKYRYRTYLNDKHLHTGNITLNITNVTMADSGQYWCCCVKNRSQKCRSVNVTVGEFNRPRWDRSKQQMMKIWYGFWCLFSVNRKTNGTAEQRKECEIQSLCNVKQFNRKASTSLRRRWCFHVSLHLWFWPLFLLVPADPVTIILAVVGGVVGVVVVLLLVLWCLMKAGKISESTFGKCLLYSMLNALCNTTSCTGSLPHVPSTVVHHFPSAVKSRSWESTKWTQVTEGLNVGVWGGTNEIWRCRNISAQRLHKLTLAYIQELLNSDKIF